MSRKYRVGIVGFAHMHINNVAQLYAAHPQVEWVACADTNPLRPELRKAPYTREWNLENVTKLAGIPKVYDCWKEMLQKETFDIIVITSENFYHPEIVEACAAAGANVCVEKPMAMSMSHALRMVRACKAAGTTLLVNWPMTWQPNARKAKELIDQGVIGRILEVKTRLGHNGPLGEGVGHAGVAQTAAPMTGPERGATWWHQAAAGGGATLDFTSYGAMSSRWYIGEPAIAAIGIKANLNSHYGDADDNGVVIARFPQAMGLYEATWTTRDHGVPGGPIVYGTEGTLVVDTIGGKPVVRLERGGGNTTVYEAGPLPAGRTTVAEEFIHHLETGEPLHPTLEAMFNLDVMAIADAGMRSAASGKIETVNSVDWNIG